jgi:hypothetical protein
VIAANTERSGGNSSGPQQVAVSMPSDAFRLRSTTWFLKNRAKAMPHKLVMDDLIFIVVMIAFFAGSALYVQFCDQLDR